MDFQAYSRQLKDVQAEYDVLAVVMKAFVTQDFLRSDLLAAKIKEIYQRDLDTEMNAGEATRIEERYALLVGELLCKRLEKTIDFYEATLLAQLHTARTSNDLERNVATRVDSDNEIEQEELEYLRNIFRRNTENHKNNLAGIESEIQSVAMMVRAANKDPAPYLGSMQQRKERISGTAVSLERADQNLGMYETYDHVIRAQLALAEVEKDFTYAELCWLDLAIDNPVLLKAADPDISLQEVVAMKKSLTHALSFKGFNHVLHAERTLRSVEDKVQQDLFRQRLENGPQSDKQ